MTLDLLILWLIVFAIWRWRKWHQRSGCNRQNGALFLHVLSLLVEARRCSVPQVRTDTTVGTVRGTCDDY